MATVALKSMFGRRVTLNQQKYYPQVLAVFGAILVWFFELDMQGTPPMLLGSAVTFGAIVSGFVGASLSILTTLDTPVMQQIRKTNYIRTLRLYLGWGLSSGVILSCVSMVGLFFMFSGHLFTAIWIAALVLCIACLYRLAWFMLLIFSDRENTPQS